MDKRMNLFKTIVLGLFLLAGVLVLPGCKDAGYLVNMAAVAANLSVLDKELDNARAILAPRMNQFSTEEQAQLRKADQELMGLQRAVHGLVQQHGNVAEVLLETEQIRIMAFSAREAYRLVRDVICPGVNVGAPVTLANCPRLSMVDGLDRFKLMAVDQRIQRTGFLIKKMLIAKDVPEGETANATWAMQDVLTIGKVAAQLLTLKTAAQ